MKQLAGYGVPSPNPIPDLTKYNVEKKAKDDAFQGLTFADGALPPI